MSTSRWLTEELRAFVDGRLVRETGFGAGPACAAMKIDRHDPPITLAQALEWLEVWRTTFRRAHIELVDGDRVLFDPSGHSTLVPSRSH